jgi:acyl-CoA thioesterase-1
MRSNRRFGPGGYFGSKTVAIREGTFTFVQMGDSITVGQHIDSRSRWSTLINDRLASALAATGRDLVSHNCGVAGEQTRMGLERYPAHVQDLGPNLMTLQFGMNDCNCWLTDRGLPRVSERSFAANLVEMIARARNFGVQAIILATNPRSLRRAILPSGEPYDEANARFSAIIRDVARETEVFLCDIRAYFDRLPDEELGPLLLPAPDLLHLSVAGHATYAELIAPLVMESALGPTADLTPA